MTIDKTIHCDLIHMNFTEFVCKQKNFSSKIFQSIPLSDIWNNYSRVILDIGNYIYHISDNILEFETSLKAIGFYKDDIHYIYENLELEKFKQEKDLDI